MQIFDPNPPGLNSKLDQQRKQGGRDCFNSRPFIRGRKLPGDECRPIPLRKL
jgi:hypothetical protein